MQIQIPGTDADTDTDTDTDADTWYRYRYRCRYRYRYRYRYQVKIQIQMYRASNATASPSRPVTSLHVSGFHTTYTLQAGLRVRRAHGTARRHAGRSPGGGHGRRLQPAPPTARHRKPRRPRALLRGRGLGVWFVTLGHKAQRFCQRTEVRADACVTVSIHV